MRMRIFDRKTAPAEPQGAGMPLWGDATGDGSAPTTDPMALSEPPWVCHLMPGDQFDVYLYKRPNLVRRIVQRILLGWRYERADGWRNAGGIGDLHGTPSPMPPAPSGSAAGAPGGSPQSPPSATPSADRPGPPPT